MALNNLLVPGKLLTTQDGTKYAYIHIPPRSSSSEPTLLLLHGFPSSSYDWRFQINFLSERGYGVIAPDLLGYGDTDKPSEPEQYKFKKMAGHLVEILGKEGVEKVVGVGHDWYVDILFRGIGA